MKKYPIGIFMLLWLAGFQQNAFAQCSGAVNSGMCSMSASSPWEDWIWGVKIGSINNNTGGATGTGNGKSTYSNYTSLCTDLPQGSNQTIELTAGFSYTTYGEYFRVWIDYNNNGSFADAGEQVAQTILSPVPPAGTPSATMTASFVVPSGAAPGPKRLRVAMRRDAYATNCTSYTYGEVEDYKVNIVSNSCYSPTITSTVPTSNTITVNWGAVSGATNYQIRIKQLPSGAWGSWVTKTTTTHLFSGLIANTSYQVELYTNCTGGSSTSTFATVSTQSYCLTNPGAGKYADTIGIGNTMNVFNSKSFREIFALNDGGLRYRKPTNPVLALTGAMRNFHTVDEDFCGAGGGCGTLPKNTTPNGNAANTAYNQGWYQTYKSLGVTNISAAFERLAGYTSWKEKMYHENDWSTAGYAGIQGAVQTYTEKFIDAFAHPTNTSLQLVNSFEVGNELWGWPEEVDYHNMLKGVRAGMIAKYGAKSTGNWKMKFVAGSMQAWRDDNCSDPTRNINNCGSDLNRFDYIGNYLNIDDCAVLTDLDAINVHPYSFVNGTTTFTYPENPSGEFFQIKNLAKWRNSNAAVSSKEMWSTEYGFDSYATGVNTQAAYNLRGLLIMSRYQFSKAYFYNAYDKDVPGSAGLYNTCGFMTSPDHNPPPQPKPTYYTFEEMIATTGKAFGNKKFFKAVKESGNMYAYIIADNNSGANPYLVFWNPSATTDSDVFTVSSTSTAVNWSSVLPNFKLENGTATFFKTSSGVAATFAAATTTPCGNASLKNTRMPAYIKLVSCCTPPSAPGITASGTNYVPGNPAIVLTATGCTGGTIKWYNSSGTQLATGTTYSVTPAQTTTYYATCTVSSCESSASNSITITVGGGGSCPTVGSFKRRPHASSGCRTSGDYYFEIVLNNVTVNDQITIAGLPTSGINITLSSLNGVNFNTTTFNANLQYVNSNTYRWIVSTANGSTQTLKLYYCWASSYPSPVSSTTATSLCSGQTTPCQDWPNFSDPAGERNEVSDLENSADWPFRIMPNPGTDEVNVAFIQNTAVSGQISLFSTNGQLCQQLYMHDLSSDQKWTLNTSTLPSGIYVLRMVADGIVQHEIWIKQ